MSDTNTTPAKTPANWLREEAQQLEDLSSALDSSFEHSDDKAFIKGLISSAEHIDRLERERDEAREQWRMSSVCRQKDADLTALRAVADEMERFIKSIKPEPPYGELEGQWVYATSLVTRYAALRAGKKGAV